ncbi:MAG: helix-turn-helix domain-containing protein [Bacteroides sp.]|nr:helix-turn-helix domain-containing protein [Bacteroides sp.]
MTFIDKETFEAWMERIVDRFDITDAKIDKIVKPPTKINGEILHDNQDLCILLRVSKRTLQRYRCEGKLEYKRIGQKTYYTEKHLHDFIRDYFDESDQIVAAK